MEAKKPIKSVPIEGKTILQSQAFSREIKNNRYVFFFSFAILFLVCAAFAVLNYQAAEGANRRAFFITQSGTYVGRNAQDDIEAKRVDIKHHVELFLHSMYSFDEHTYEKNIRQGLELIGDDGKVILGEYTKLGLQSKLSQLNLVFKVEIDSVWVKVDTTPYTAYVFARQTQETSISKTQNFLWAQMTFRDMHARTDKNPFGMKIENLRITNKDVIN